MEKDPQLYYEGRLADIARLKNIGYNCYPSDFKPTLTISEFITTFYDVTNTDTNADTATLISVSGRIQAIRSSSKKLIFYNITQSGARLQILCNRAKYSDEFDFDIVTKFLKRNDVIGVVGQAGRSKTGELSIVANKIIILSPCLKMLTTDSLVDKETRYRSRYLDMICNKTTVETFKIRSAIILYLRNYLNKQNFIEVETPILNNIVGGANAKPFVTYHNCLNMNLSLRISPELYLKQLVIGGIDRVFEIGRVFRNEGIDLTHNPEFTILEFYIANTNYVELMTIAETLLSDLVATICKSLNINVGNRVINFEPPYRRIDIMTELQLNGIDNLDFSDDSGRDYLDKICTERNIECSNPRTTARLLDKLIGYYIEPQCINPTFVTGHPEVLSPLAKTDINRPGITERFELFVNGFELCNAYTELNDPIVQRQRFTKQVNDREKYGDDESQLFNEDYCVALEHALPPTGGFGLGIDRLVMLLTNNSSIREVILFPTMKNIN